MNRNHATARRRLAAPFGALLMAAVWGHAAVPVEESVPVTRSGAAQAPRAPAPAPTAVPADPVDSRLGGGESARLTELFYQLQVLQQEVQELRGVVEAQSHQINRLARDQQEQYLDLDRRMQAVRGGVPAAPSASGAPAVDLPATGSAGGSAGERDAYAAAFELMRQRQFEASIRAFRELVQAYPNGAMTANAFYWIGELHLAQDDIEPARQAFAQVLNLYPDHQKIPDTLYKLGVVYHRLGDLDRARDHLNRVRNQHPQSSAAGLARTYLAEL
jgi:tol-pal system protein YbgF